MPATKLRDDGRIPRLISIAYFLSTRTEIHIDELCERLEISREQLESDLNVLMFCGLPPYSPEQLFDISIEDDFVSMYFNDVFVSPLRLKNNEIVQVLIALERLKSSSSTDQEKTLISNTISKINESQSSPIEVEYVQTKTSDLIQEALKDNLKLRVNYLSLNSAKISDRVVVPQAIYNTSSISYLFAIEESSNSSKLFRVDRILEAQILRDEIAIDDQPEVDLQEHFQSNSEQLFIDDTNNYVDLVINDQANWLLDSVPQEIIDESANVYRFFTSSPYFVARLLLSNYPNIEYQDGTIAKDQIIGAVEDIKAQMQATKLSK